MTGTTWKPPKSEWISGWKRSAAAVIWTLGTSAFTALAVDREWLRFESVGYAAMGILITAGYLCGRGGKQERKLLQGIVSAAAYMAMLLMLNLLLFGGAFESVLLCAGLIFMGVLLRTWGTGSRGGRKRAYKIPKG